MELEVRDVSKLYNKTLVVKNVNLCMKKGIYGLLGANGAGKTTLMSSYNCVSNCYGFYGSRNIRIN